MSGAADPPAHPGPSDEVAPDRRAWITLALLTSSLFVAYTNRFIFAVLVQPIKATFKLSDSQLGLLTGLVFSTALAIGSIPVARWADRGSRKSLIGCCSILWCGLTAICGLCQSFGQLLATRTLIGAAEAATLPPPQSMIADLFPPGRRATALGIFNAGACVGSILSFPIGAWLEYRVGWRGALICVGVPGVLFSMLFMVLVREPQRRYDAAADELEGSARENWASAARALWRIGAFRQIVLAHTAALFLDYGQVNWMAAYFERSFGTSRMALGSMLTTTKGIGMLIGVLLGGFLADRLAGKGLRGPTVVILFARTLVILPTIAIYLAPNVGFAYAMAALSGVLTWMSIAPDNAILMTIIPAHRRATASALALVSSSIVGMGLGPYLVGLMSDMLTAHYGIEALRVSLLLLSVVGTIWTLLHYIMMAYHLRQNERVSALAGDGVPAAI